MGKSEFVHVKKPSFTIYLLHVDFCWYAPARGNLIDQWWSGAGRFRCEFLPPHPHLGAAPGTRIVTVYSFCHNKLSQVLCSDIGTKSIPRTRGSCPVVSLGCAGNSLPAHILVGGGRSHVFDGRTALAEALHLTPHQLIVQAAHIDQLIVGPLFRYSPLSCHTHAPHLTADKLLVHHTHTATNITHVAFLKHTFCSNTRDALTHGRSVQADRADRDGTTQASNTNIHPSGILKKAG